MAAACLTMTACVGPAMEPAEVGPLMDRAVLRAEEWYDQGGVGEALMFLSILEQVDADDPDVVVLRRRLASADPLPEPILGRNVTNRVPVERGFWSRVGWYLPDRALDLVDILSVDLHAGWGLYANVRATRALQLGVGMRDVAGVGWHGHRSLGVMYQQDAGFNAPFGFGAETSWVGIAGTAGAAAQRHDEEGLIGPSAPIYQDVRDYWGVGASVTLLVAGAEIELHPVEVADFLTGIVLIDLSGDDVATTRGVDFNEDDRRMIRRLLHVAASEDLLAGYREFESAGSVLNQPRP